MIVKYQLGQLQTNCYLLINGNECLIIDPADEADFILEELQRRKIKLTGILATHGHFDHIGAVGEIQLSCNVPLYISEDDQFLVDRLNETADYFLGYDPHFLKPVSVKYLTETRLRVKDWELEVIPCPGHTPGGCSFYLKKHKVVFTGDTLFKQNIGRYDFSYCSKNDLKDSLKKLMKLPQNTLVYPGHGEQTEIGDEKTVVKLIV